VSHHLVTGIAQNGGGLSEVIPMDSAGGWMEKVIRMLVAALTPSNWNIDITLEESTGNGKDEASGCIQAPYRLRDIHAFSRKSIFLLVRRKCDTKLAKVKATAIGSGESITAELLVETLDTQRPYLHQLAARAVLRDLESGQSWSHDTNFVTKNLDSQSAIFDSSKIEGEKLGIEW
jgi:hypothetical protein